VETMKIFTITLWHLLAGKKELEKDLWQSCCVVEASNYTRSSPVTKIQNEIVVVKFSLL